jgi:hypothetical protein
LGTTLCALNGSAQRRTDSYRYITYTPRRYTTFLFKSSFLRGGCGVSVLSLVRKEPGVRNQDNKNQEKRVNNIYTEDYKKELDSRIKAYKNGRVVYSEEEVMKSLKQILNKNQQR